MCVEHLCSKMLGSFPIPDTMWSAFLGHQAMEEIMRRGSFIHVDVPGQENDAKDLPAE